ncbi:hypothetical protein FOZ60_015904 [Perkinsus olseni]|uniref:NADP-dependent oxidoreductase domain-containing protein n=1 Tax=Perkinsus olseni TaxID=32597 RepID=A0A7J6P5W1_PEROL|nr:hypothetical protein FOZ60_015904 [Perkinsus olseni]
MDNSGTGWGHAGYGICSFEFVDTSVDDIAQACGHRLIDTAQMYENEEEVGQGVAESGVPREDILIVTKVNQLNHGERAMRVSVEESLAKLETGYGDLILIHTPTGGKLVESWCTL